MAVLKVQTKKSDTIEEFELSLDRITIGRAPDNVLVLDDKAASRHHAEIQRSPEGWRLKDLGSSNGTWVDGKKVQTCELKDGVFFLIGNTRLTFAEPVWDGRTMQVDMQEMMAEEGFSSAEKPVPAQPEARPAPITPDAPPIPPRRDPRSCRLPSCRLRLRHNRHLLPQQFRYRLLSRLRLRRQWCLHPPRFLPSNRCRRSRKAPVRCGLRCPRPTAHLRL